LRAPPPLADAAGAALPDPARCVGLLLKKKIKKKGCPICAALSGTLGQPYLARCDGLCLKKRKDKRKI
jgi:hypothetical protein